MADKYDLSNTLVSEYSQYNTLFLKGSTRTNTGVLSFTSTSSSTTYDSTTGEEGIFSQLYDVLLPYIISASDFNTINNHPTTNDASTGAKGHIQIATNAEVTTGTDTTKAVTPAGVKVELDKKVNATALGTAAYTASTAYATAAQGTLATNALPKSGGTMSGELNCADQLVTRPKFKDYSESLGTTPATTGTVTLDLTTGNTFNVTPTGAITFVFSNPPASGSVGSFTLIINMPATLYTMTFPASVVWNGGNTPTYNTSKTAILSFLTKDGGTRYYGSNGGANFTT